MPGYDWSFGGRGPRPPRPRGGYAWGYPQETTGPTGPRDVRYGRWEGGGGYDRGVYGDAYEAYSPGYGGQFAPPRGPSQGWGGYGRQYRQEMQGGYAQAYREGGQGYARGPFLPEQAYRRHPELDRAPGPHGARWGYELDDTGMDLGDDEILDAVRRRLYEDVWLDVERLEVQVEDGVVTLRGEVDDFLEVRYAWDDAWETPGVRGVVTQLTVRVDQGETNPHHDLLPQTTQGTSSEPSAG